MKPTHLAKTNHQSSTIQSHLQRRIGPVKLLSRPLDQWESLLKVFLWGCWKATGRQLVLLWQGLTSVIAKAIWSMELEPALLRLLPAYTQFVPNILCSTNNLGICDFLLLADPIWARMFQVGTLVQNIHIRMTDKWSTRLFCCCPGTMHRSAPCKLLRMVQNR